MQLGRIKEFLLGKRLVDMEDAPFIHTPNPGSHQNRCRRNPRFGNCIEARYFRRNGQKVKTCVRVSFTQIKNQEMDTHTKYQTLLVL